MKIQVRELYELKGWRLLLKLKPESNFGEFGSETMILVFSATTKGQKRVILRNKKQSLNDNVLSLSSPSG
jgi:hypothetical protein